MNAVAAWLCEANKGGTDEGYSAVTKRALKWRAGYGRPEDPDWVRVSLVFPALCASQMEETEI